MRFDRLILSSDLNPKFIEFVPLVTAGWHKFFGDIEIWLALVGKPKAAQLAELKKHCCVEVYLPVDGIPLPNQAKVARYHLAAAWNDDSVVMTNDVDLLPLQADYVCNLLCRRPPEHLMTIGSELYTGNEKGKFTAGYLTAESSTWKRLVNPLGYNWTEFVLSFVNLRVFDHKEDIRRAVHHENPDTFSDESLLRALLRYSPVPVMHLPRGYNPYTARALCRSNWMLDPKKLADGTYVEAHLPRPWNEHKDKIEPLETFIKNA